MLHKYVRNNSENKWKCLRWDAQSPPTRETRELWTWFPAWNVTLIQGNWDKSPTEQLVKCYCMLLSNQLTCFVMVVSIETRNCFHTVKGYGRDILLGTHVAQHLWLAVFCDFTWVNSLASYTAWTLVYPPIPFWNCPRQCIGKCILHLCLYGRNIPKETAVSESQNYAVEKIQVIKQNGHVLYLNQNVPVMVLQNVLMSM